MKSIFLFLSVCIFCSGAIAQFDIQNHLAIKQNKRATKIDKKKNELLLPGFKIPSLDFFEVQSRRNVLINMDTIVINPLYNMPVITTDMSRFKVMPNIGEDYFTKENYDPYQLKPYQIPNGASELPSRKKLQNLLKQKITK